MAAELATRVRVFEVDHPDSQAAKRDRLHALGVPADATSFVPVDLERDSPLDALCRAGIDLSRPFFVSWLGVTMYLTRAAVARAIHDPRALPPGSHLVLDHMVPPGMRDAAAQTYVGPRRTEHRRPRRAVVVLLHPGRDGRGAVRLRRHHQH